MVKIFKEEPTWVDYNDEHDFTIALKDYWTTKTLSGGPLYESLMTESVPGITTPLVDMIETIPTYSSFLINAVQDSITKLPFSYYDIWILATNPADVPFL